MNTVGYIRLSTAVTTIEDSFLFSGGILVNISSFPAANTRIDLFLAASLQTRAHSAATFLNCVLAILSCSSTGSTLSPLNIGPIDILTTSAS